MAKKLETDLGTNVIVEVPTVQYPKATSICIRPYIDPTIENMGLERYDMVVHSGIVQTEFIFCREMNGIKEYVTGLNEYAREVEELKNQDPEKYEAVVKQIRKDVAMLERKIASNIIKEDDPEFWNKVKLLKPNNTDFWSKIYISVGNEPVYLDINNPFDFIKIKAIEAGGFSIIGKSYEYCRMSSNPPKFYLDKSIETITTKSEVKMVKNRAIAALTSMYEKNPDAMLFIIKSLSPNPTHYTRSTPPIVIYDELDNYLNGRSWEKNEKRAAEEFLNAVKESPEIRKLKCIVKESCFRKYIVYGSDGMMRHHKTSTILGRNLVEVVEFLKNPINDNIYLDLLKAFDKHLAE